MSRKLEYHIIDEQQRLLFPLIKELIVQIARDDEKKGKSIKKPYSVEDDTIVFHDAEDDVDYVYILSNSDVREKQTQTNSMSESGASWFSAMRGEKEDPHNKASNKWNAMITDLSTDFYKSNPFLYYEDLNDYNRGGKTEDRLRAIVETFFDENEVSITEAQDNAIHDIYAASLRLEVGNSIGVPLPILGKLYCSMNQAGKLEFLSVDRASKLEENIGSAQEPEGEQAETNGSMCVKILEALSGMLNQQDQERNHLERNLVFNEDNINAINKMVDSVSGDGREIPLEIKSIKINTIMWIKTKAKQYDICFKKYTHHETEPVLRATVFFDKITLTCVGCVKQLIEDDVINYVTKKGMEKKIEIGFDEGGIFLLKDGRRLDQESATAAIAEAKEQLFRDHLRKAVCEACAIHDGCVGYPCKKSQLFAKSFNPSEHAFTEVVRCKDCAYPESFVELGENAAYLTDSVFFDVNSRKILAKYDEDGVKQYVTCSICGRSFLKKGAEEYCDLCKQIAYEEDGKISAQKRLYRKYAGLLPLRRRIFVLDKRCVEDASVIVFRLKRKYYVFDKIEAIISGNEYLTEKKPPKDEV